MMALHRGLLALALLALVACAGAEQAPRREARRAAERPNVLIIMSDDHGYQATGAYGSFLCSEQYCYRFTNAARNRGAPDTGASHVGFRCARDA